MFIPLEINGVNEAHHDDNAYTNHESNQEDFLSDNHELRKRNADAWDDGPQVYATHFRPTSKGRQAEAVRGDR